MQVNTAGCGAEGMGTGHGVKRARRLAAALPLTALAITVATVAHGQSLEDALVQAYQNNPTLEAGRAGQRATDEGVPQARAAMLPTVTADGNLGKERLSQGNAIQHMNPAQSGVTINQAIYAGGSIQAGISQAENTVEAGRAGLLDTEQQVLLAAATAYLDVVRDQAVLDLNINNEQVLTRQLEASRDRFRVGELTRTDVSQSESRLAGATADRISAQGALAASRATYAKLMGQVPGTLKQPTRLVHLPVNQEETMAAAEVSAPVVVAARYNHKASQDAVDGAFGQMLPQLSASAQYYRNWDQSLPGVQYDTAVISARVTIPLYEGGGTSAKVRGAKQTEQQRRTQVMEAVRSADETAVKAWQALVTARAAIEAYKSAVASNEIALEGVRQEQSVGSRTILDVLNAEQELVNAKVQLVRAQHDEQVAAYEVLSAVGDLTAAKLGLNVPLYDAKAHYEEVKDKLWGPSIEK
ncbi:outer membrane protein/adhesin transport system outer membrane protein [Nitrospirillum amazonense]|uniref:Outer membrane protein/adhesin transport system outer membrane protein n=2 Tax=Nitrospirillum amazonense TaxID=28077 RepID=A0A560FA08_9PROT|nr:outer membrane protein/adhesin transport system outer membrane protein [Nitrospirillum amazonense]